MGGELDGFNRRRQPQRDLARKACGNQRAVAGAQAPVVLARGLVVGHVVRGRKAFEIRAADETHDGADVRVPFAVGIQRVGGAITGRRRGGQSLRPGFECLPRRSLFRRRESQVAILRAPGRTRLVERNRRGPGNRGPGVSIRGMQPARAQVQIQATDFLRAGAAAEARSRFQQQGRQAAAGETSCGAHAGGTASDDDDVEVRAQNSLTPVSSASFATSSSWKRASSEGAAGCCRSR